MSPKKIEFNNGETVVYPKHGVGEIIKIESMEISSIKTKFYVVKMEQSKLTIRVPIEKQEEVGLRKISSKKISEILVKNKIATRNDNFYAWRCLKAFDIDHEDGVVRISLVHYNLSLIHI